ncbi:extracellular matrix glycoprotein pherophorin-V14 [Volvox carteri f. nagariensis]|uniref:Extracellular matrix glycoprotein pherophorin-V14 n=1 Tax=Volvox carteri f. nagariensis TaxID=3068 RepID=D8TTQ4_VOLCA|nr:extracellular matrix glycoprotein pherophorin-V14 [Volvox carteri f. nagariensis]EFJ49351.1 extracellular matrix glycoprotein pherophorin-V14 [Volvox carteri f. nagariensis]|eukprot:XP_002949799.1 extracellular matrix glycoprotein pherophorin-V14 [Volvox carteri f. nagariensis]
MARTLIALAVAAVIAIAWAPTADAQDEDFDAPFGEQTGLIPNFPYRICNTQVGAYRFAPEVKHLSGGRFCFTIKVQTQGCTHPCCFADLYKIEFNVSDSCIVQPSADIKATINGNYTRIGAAFGRPVYGRNGSAILRLTQLGLNTVTAANAEVCLILKANRLGKGCTTLEQLCVPPPGAARGMCAAAMYDTPCDCCPPPSLPPPPSPPDITPNPVCRVCIIISLLPPSFDINRYRFDNRTCSSIQDYIAASINASIVSNNIPMQSYFAPNASLCSPLEIRVCGTFVDANGANQLKAAVELQTQFWIKFVAGGEVCRAELDRYAIQISTEAGSCLPLIDVESCNLDFKPFPNCSCKTRQGILPFTISPRYFPLKNKFTTEYCFVISTLPPDQILPSTCRMPEEILTKIEWYANQTSAGMIAGFTLYPAGGSKSRRSTSWGAYGTNTLKATNINWTLQEAHGGMVCIEVKKPGTLKDVCLGFSSQCYVSTFNRNKDCCPIYRADLAPTASSGLR